MPTAWLVRSATSTCTKRADSRLVHDALHDGLTGLPNQAMFIEHANRALAQRRRGDLTQIAILAINLSASAWSTTATGTSWATNCCAGSVPTSRLLMRDGDVCARGGVTSSRCCSTVWKSSIDALRICEQLDALPAFAPDDDGQR